MIIPGLSTLVISSTYCFLSGMCSPDSHAHTRSNLSSSCVIFRASITWKLTLGMPLSLASSVARLTWFGEMVMPTSLCTGYQCISH